jgi:hypothetical protein
MVICPRSMVEKYQNTPSSMRLAAAAATLLAANGVILTGHAQPAEGVLVDVEACLVLETRAELLACYEERVNEALRARESRSGSGPGDAQPTAARTAAAPEPEESGETRRAERRAERDAERQQRELERRQRAAAEATLAAAEAVAALEDPEHIAGEIVGQIVGLREMEPDAYIITLDNGQVWRQSQPKRYPLFVGTTVELRPSPWGPSYRLTDPDVGNFIQVRRVD